MDTNLIIWSLVSFISGLVFSISVDKTKDESDCNTTILCASLFIFIVSSLMLSISTLVHYLVQWIG